MKKKKPTNRKINLIVGILCKSIPIKNKNKYKTNKPICNLGKYFKV